MADDDRPGWYSPLYGLSDEDVATVSPRTRRLLGVGGAMGVPGTIALAVGQGLGIKPLEYGGAALTAASLVPLSMGTYNAMKEAEERDRPLIPSSPYFHGGTALLAAAPVMGISMPKAMRARADVAQKIIDRATNDGMRLQRGIGELEEVASPGLQDLAARLSRRAEAGTRMRDKALQQLATEGKILKGMGVGAGVLGAGLTAKGLYDHFHKEAAVPRAKKEYRRALQMLLEGQHAFHGTAGSAGKYYDAATDGTLKNILNSGELRPGTVNRLSPDGVQEVYFGVSRPVTGTFNDRMQGLFAVPTDTALAGSGVSGAKPRVLAGADRNPHGPYSAIDWAATPHPVPLRGATLVTDAPVPVEVRKAQRLRTIGAEPFMTALEDLHPGAEDGFKGPGRHVLYNYAKGEAPSKAWMAAEPAREAARRRRALLDSYASAVTGGDAERAQYWQQRLQDAGIPVPTQAPSVAKTAGMAQAFHDLGFRETSGRLFEKIALGMTLRFNSPEEVQEHNTKRNVVGALGGGLLGGAAGGALGGRLLGLPGAVMGGVAGAALGSVPGKLLADTAHDYRERTTSTYNDTMQRLNAAAGGNIRVASALDEFIQFADQDAQQRESADADPAHASGFQTDQEKRERPPGFGPPSALAGADAGTRMMQIGLPTGGAV